MNPHLNCQKVGYCLVVAVLLSFTIFRWTFTHRFTIYKDECWSTGPFDPLCKGVAWHRGVTKCFPLVWGVGEPPCFPGFSKKLLTTNDNKNPHASWIFMDHTDWSYNRQGGGFFFLNGGWSKKNICGFRTLTGFAAGAPAVVRIKSDGLITELVWSDGFHTQCVWSLERVKSIFVAARCAA